jgi:hypothetical protein
MGSENLLGPVHPDDRGMKCLVLDLDETLVHSSFKPTQNPDYIIPVDIEGTIHRVYVCKRPGVDEVSGRVGKWVDEVGGRVWVGGWVGVGEWGRVAVGWRLGGWLGGWPPLCLLEQY